MMIAITVLLIIRPKDEIVYDYKKLNNSEIVVVNDFNIRYNDYIDSNYFNGESIETISSKLNRYLNSNLTDKGEFIARYSIEVGVDPYLVTAVILEESGCMWTCSYLAQVCNNYGGQKGSPGCNGGSYRSFDSQEEGLMFTINKLASYYYDGLTTPEQINPKYATSTAWASKINNYIDKLMS